MTFTKDTTHKGGFPNLELLPKETQRGIRNLDLLLRKHMGDFRILDFVLREHKGELLKFGYYTNATQRGES